MESIEAETADYRDQVAEILEALPDDKSLPFHTCCMAAAVHGPARCTCWVEVYDIEQRAATGNTPADIEKCCNDCAFRADSPERSANSNHACSAEAEGELPDVPVNVFFFCHKGMRKTIAAIHQPTGFKVSFSHGNNYSAPNHNGKPLLASGDYAPLCAGYASTRHTTTACAHATLDK